MKATKHKITHHYQPTANTCGYAALAILLSHYKLDAEITPQIVMASLPQPRDVGGKTTGSITAQLASWCLDKGYSLDFYSFDCQILDLSWEGLNAESLIERLEAVRDQRHVLSLGEKYWSREYVQAYIDLLQAGGKLKINAHVTSKQLYDLLINGPLYVNICSATVNNQGRLVYPRANERLAVPDDENGSVGTHSVVVYGNDEHGNFLVADPWEGLETINAETIICGITAAQIECDNQCFQIRSRTSPRN